MATDASERAELVAVDRVGLVDEVDDLDIIARRADDQGHGGAPLLVPGPGLSPSRLRATAAQSYDDLSALQGTRVARAAADRERCSSAAGRAG
ncbi:MAG TPA: hypothetical protein VFY87_27630 [Geminicoccaceae bacterium]|nr:hypothetical protein [Geminicoccaceae bacterium]